MRLPLSLTNMPVRHFCHTYENHLPYALHAYFQFKFKKKSKIKKFNQESNSRPSRLQLRMLALRQLNVKIYFTKNCSYFTEIGIDFD